jgi:hypothetical protein
MRAKGILELKLGGDLQTNIYSRSFLGNGADWLVEQLTEGTKKSFCYNKGHPKAADDVTGKTRSVECKKELEDFFST